MTSTCAETGDVIELMVSRNGINSQKPGGTVISFVAPDEADLKKNVTVSFCHLVHFLRDRIAGERWISRHDGALLLSLDDAFEIGKKVNHARYRDTVKIKRRTTGHGDA